MTRDQQHTVAADAPIEEIVGAITQGLSTAPEVTGRYHAVIEQKEPSVQAWVERAEITELIESSCVGDNGDASANGPLAGIPFAVKDLIDVAGFPTRAGSSVSSPDIKTTDAPCVRRLRELGAVVAGKSVTTEFGYFTPGPTQNPRAPARTPGGSSSGSAAAVAAGMVPLALGTQTAGSLSRPAAYCGVAGMVLAQSSTSTDGITGLAHTLDSLGLITRTVRDLEWVWRAFTGTSAAVASAPASTVLMWQGSDLYPLDPPMSALLDRLPAVLDSCGILTTDLNRDRWVRSLAEAHLTVMAREAADTLNAAMRDQLHALSPALQKLISTGAEVTSQHYDEAIGVRTQGRRTLESLLADTTVIVGPAAPGVAPLRSEGTGNPVLSRPWQLLGAPVVIIPGAGTTDGLPLGIQIIGTPGNEDRLFEIGRRLETALRTMDRISSDSIAVLQRESS